MTAAADRPTPARPWHHRGAVVDVAVLVAAWAVAAVRVLWSGRGLDDLTYATPAQDVTLRAWGNWDLPLWSSGAFGGTPHLGNTQTAALYPGHLVAAPFPDLLGGDVMLIAHVLVFGGGLYLLGRTMGWLRPAPLLMAVAGMWSGATVFRSPLLVHFPPLAWAPLAMVVVMRVVRSERPWRTVAALAVLTWCVLCSGHPQSTLMALVLCGGWALGVVVETRAWRRVAHLALGAGLGAVMAAPVLMALAHSVDASAGGGRSEALLRTPGFFVPLRAAPRLLLGQAFLSLDGLYGQGETLTYVGAAVLALAAVGLVAAVRARAWAVVVLAGLGAVAGTWALGPRSPTLRFARAVIPGFDEPRVSARWMWVLAMSLLVLAGAGVDRLRRGRAPREAIAVGAGVVAILVLALAGEAGGADRDVVVWLVAAGAVLTLALARPQPVLRGAAVVLGAVLVLELGLPMARVVAGTDAGPAAVADLGGPAQEYLRGSEGFTIAITNDVFEAEYLVKGMRPNVQTVFDIRSMDGYDGGVSVSRRWHALLLQIIPTINDLTFRAQTPVSLDAKAFARMGVRHALYDPTRGPADVALPGWQLVLDGPFQVYENPLWHGDVTAWYTTELADSPEDAGNRIREDGPALSLTGLVEAPAAVLTCDECLPDAFHSTSAADGERVVDVDLPHPAVVALPEQFDDGWTVTVDGHDAEVVAVDGVWAGVVVAEGQHHIVLDYAPGWVWPAFAVAALGAGLVVWMWCIGGPVADGATGGRRRLRLPARVRRGAKIGG
ncbi:MAG: hypothetical protein KDB17_08735 [Ilumatobacter sp.]|nr:hypothetical protein [Ilumatobacter sp.]